MQWRDSCRQNHIGSFPDAAAAPYSGHGEETRLPKKIRQNPEIKSAPPRRAADRAGAAGTASVNAPPASPLPLAGEGQGGGASTSRAFNEAQRGFDEAPQAHYGTAATIPTLDPELARQLGLPTAEDDEEALARPPRSKMEALGVKATADALENLIREGRPEFKGEDGSLKVWTPHRPPRPEKSEGGV